LSSIMSTLSISKSNFFPTNETHWRMDGKPQ
jgi:hypothetical protein